MGVRIIFYCLLQSSLFFSSAIAQEANEQAAPDQTVAADAEANDTQEKEKDSGRGRFLALPFVITEPAVGEGLGAGLIYFHRTTDSEPPKISNGKTLAEIGKRPKPPPTASGAFGLYTNNGTYAYGFYLANIR